MPGRILSGFCLALMTACLGTSPAAAAEYSLTPAGCVEDQGSTAGCGRAAPALDDPTAVAVSPDGTSVYVASAADDAVAIFRRAADGTLTPQGCVGDTGTTVCGTAPGDRQAGLDGVADLTVTPDGLHVFAVSPVDDTIVHLRRDPSTGALTPGGCFDDPSGTDLCFFQIAGLDGARAVAAVDPPGGNAFVFVGASTFGPAGALLRFLYGPVNLEDGGCVFSDADAPLAGCPVADGLGGVDDLAFSPDDAAESLYAVGKEDDAIARFDQDGSSLAYHGCIADQTGGEASCGATAPGLEGPRAVTVSPDGAQVYVAAASSSALTMFNRDDRGLTGTPDGALTPIGCIRDVGTGPECGGSAPGLDGAFNVAATADGESVYVASISGALAGFARPAPRGPLSPSGCVEAPDTSTGCATSAPGLGLNLGLAISPDGRSVYVTSSAADTLAAFRRAPVEPPGEAPGETPGGTPPGETPGGTPPAGGAGGAPGGGPAAPSSASPPPPSASVGGLAPPRILGLERDRRAGTATLTVAVSRAGVLTLRRERWLRPARRRASAAGKLRVVLRPDRAGRARLRERGALAVRARLALATGGEVATATRRVRLVLGGGGAGRRPGGAGRRRDAKGRRPGAGSLPSELRRRRAFPGRPGRIVFTAGGAIRTVDADGRHRRFLGWGAEPTYSPDGRLIAFVEGDGIQSDLMLMRSDGSHPRAVRRTRGVSETGPAFSADGARLLFEARPAEGRYGEGEGADIYSVALDGGDPRRLTATRGEETEPQAAANGRFVVFVRSGRVFTMRPDGSRPRRLAIGASPTVSPDSHRVAFTRNGQLYSIAPSGRRPRALTHLPNKPGNFTRPRSPAFSPDGRRLVFAEHRSVSEGPGFHDSQWLATIPARGGTPRRLVAGNAGADDPDWQPSG